MKHMPVVVVSYMGGGFSETYKSRQTSKEEHTRSLKSHFSPEEYKKYDRKLLYSGIKLKRALASTKYFYKLYRRLGGLYYNLRDIATGKYICKRRYKGYEGLHK